MQSGIAEADAYERFGRRCQMPEYIRLGTVLSAKFEKRDKGLKYDARTGGCGILYGTEK